MNFTLTKAIAVAFPLLASSGVHAATVWMPTDGDLNVLGTENGTLAIFDDADATLSGSRLELARNDLVDFISSGSDYILSNLAGDNLTLTGGNKFRFGFLKDGGSMWNSDVAWDNLGNNAYEVLFGNTPTPADGNSTLVDLTASSVAPPAAIPIPAPLALLGSGLAGLVAVGRKRRTR